MKKRWIDKGISAVGTVLFVGSIRSENPPMWAVAALAIGIYECALWACRIARTEARKERKRRYITVRKQDAERWASTRIGWPMKEVG